MEISKGRGALTQLQFQNLSRDPDDDDSFALLSKIINGALGGFLGVMTLFPLDTIKTRLQSQKRPIYRNWYHALGMIIHQEGFKGLYHGFGITLGLVTPELTAKLVTYDYIQHRWQSSGGDLTIVQKTLAAAIAGFVQIHITTPSELIKVQLQTSTAQHKTQRNPHALHSRDVFRSLLQDEGIFGLYRGYVVTILRDVTFAMIYFPLYSIIVDRGPLNKSDPERPADWVAFCAGCSAALVAAVVVTPFDVVKTRMQADIKAYDGILHCFRKNIHCHGAKTLFSGATCRALLIAPLLGICQMVYSFNLAEQIRNMLEKSEGGTEL